MKKQYIIMLLLILIITLTGCSNSFKSCHERCMDIEKWTLDNNCEEIFNRPSKVVEKCQITYEEVLNYQNKCLDICVNQKSLNN